MQHAKRHAREEATLPPPPTPAEIADRAAAIQATWDRRTEHRRLVMPRTALPRVYAAAVFDAE